MIFNDFSGGIADGILRGIKGSFASMVGLDIHSEPGVLKVNQKLTKNSGTTVTELCKHKVVASDGNMYFFSADSGKIWKKTSADAWSLVSTNAKGACIGAREYNGYIYYAATGFIGRQSVANASSEATWSSHDDDWQTLSNGDTAFAPMEEVNNILFIGNGKYVASWDGSTYQDNAFDLNSEFRVSALYPDGIYLLVGTYIGTGTTNLIKSDYCKIFKWDAFSDSYDDSDVVYESGINAFIPVDNNIFVQAGIWGNIYYFNGSQLIPFKRIVGTYSSTRYGIVYPEAVGLFNGLPVFGFSNSPDSANSTGNPAYCGVYSLGQHNKNYPRVLNLEFPVSATSPLASVEIGCIAVSGTNLYVAWKKQGGSPTYGVDKLDYSNKYASAFIESLVVNQGVFKKRAVSMFAGYRLLPASTSIGFSHKKNYATNYTAISGEENDTNLNIIKKEENITNTRAFQMKMDFTVNSNDAPEVDYFGFDLYE